ncbi:MAG TPA: TolC family protein, partial [Myxococcales bacterium]|nr:TolC family protein [Myxococcales bacterium]
MSARRKTILPIAAVLAASCNFAPAYTRPTVTPTQPDPPTAWKELTPGDFASTDGWKQAQPQDAVLRGNWWEMFHDPLLNDLQQQVDAANQTLAQAWANYRAARAAVALSRSQLYPTVTTTPSATRSGTGLHATNQFQLPVDAAWEVDLWGSVRNQVAASSDEAQATGADLENTRLSLHGQLAVNYFQLRGQDAQRQLLDETVVAFRKTLELTKVKHEYGTASDFDVAQAQ